MDDLYDELLAGLASVSLAEVVQLPWKVPIWFPSPAYSEHLLWLARDFTCLRPAFETFWAQIPQRERALTLRATSEVISRHAQRCRYTGHIPWPLVYSILNNPSHALTQWGCVENPPEEQWVRQATLAVVAEAFFRLHIQ